MSKQPKRFTPEEMVAFIRKHLLDGVTVSDLCDANGLDPTLYYRWQKEFFDAGEAAFLRKSERQIDRLNQCAGDNAGTAAYRGREHRSR